jgi:hypothetical protein
VRDGGAVGLLPGARGGTPRHDLLIDGRGRHVGIAASCTPPGSAGTNTVVAKGALVDGRRFHVRTREERRATSRFHHICIDFH